MSVEVHGGASQVLRKDGGRLIDLLHAGLWTSFGS